MNPQYCIYEIEAHPDRLIGEIYGPYENEKDAEDAAVAMEESPHNMISPSNKRYYYRIQELIPSNAL